MPECPFCLVSRRGFMARSAGGALMLVAGALLGGTRRAVAQEGLASEQLGMGHTEYSELVGGPADFYTLKITFAPGTVIDWHRHPGPVFAEVVSGALTNPYDLSGCSVTSATGAAVYIPAGATHQDRNDGSVPLVVYSTFIVPAGSPLRIPADAPTASTCGAAVQAPAHR